MSTSLNLVGYPKKMLTLHLWLIVVLATLPFLYFVNLTKLSLKTTRSCHVLTRTKSSWNVLNGFKGHNASSFELIAPHFDLLISFKTIVEQTTTIYPVCLHYTNYQTLWKINLRSFCIMYLRYVYSFWFICVYSSILTACLISYV